jgi:hypothetical protein
MDEKRNKRTALECGRWLKAMTKAYVPYADQRKIANQRINFLLRRCGVTKRMAMQANR